ncbi:MAG: hypothetical protein EXR70_17495 [Deltaproteobacteria bacterium]|nr:hypothetical protein [Deltaproteobacteria bacterium]
MAKSALVTKEKMKQKFPDQWLLLSDYKLDASTTLRQGRVVANSKNRDDIHRALKELKGNFCIHYTGQLPRDTGVLF